MRRSGLIVAVALFGLPLLGEHHEKPKPTPTPHHHPSPKPSAPATTSNNSGAHSSPSKTPDSSHHRKDPSPNSSRNSSSTGRHGGRPHDGTPSAPSVRTNVSPEMPAPHSVAPPSPITDAKPENTRPAQGTMEPAAKEIAGDKAKFVVSTPTKVSAEEPSAHRANGLACSTEPCPSAAIAETGAKSVPVIHEGCSGTGPCPPAVTVDNPGKTVPVVHEGCSGAGPCPPAVTADNPGKAVPMVQQSCVGTGCQSCGPGQATDQNGKCVARAAVRFCPGGSLWNGAACVNTRSQITKPVAQGFASPAPCSIYSTRAAALAAELRSLKREIQSACGQNNSGQACSSAKQELSMKLLEYSGLQTEAPIECRAFMPSYGSLL